VLPAWLARSAEISGRILPAVRELLDSGVWDPDRFPENALLGRALAGTYLPPMNAFRPRELRALVEAEGFRVLRLGGIGTLAHLCGPETWRRLFDDPRQREGFLDLCERFDAEVLPDGPGTRSRAGLLVVAERAGLQRSPAGA
jgi:hypothetical protein